MAGKRRARAVVLSVRPGRRRERTPLCYAFRPPRTTLFAPLPSPDPESAALAIASLAGPDPTVLVCGGAGAVLLRDALAKVLPAAEVFACDPRQILGFLWVFRDTCDPLLLGHAGEQEIPGETSGRRRPPDLAAARGPRAARLEERRVRELVIEMGRALGVRPPLPDPDDPLSRWGPRRMAPVYDAVMGLYAGLLHRWGAPLARRRSGTAGADEIVLAGRKW